MKGGLSSALLVLSCVHQRSVPSTSSDPGSSSVFLKPWHRLAPGNERGAAWRTPPGRLHSPPPAVYNGRWTKCPLSVERKSKSVHCYQFFIVTQYSFYLVNSMFYMREVWLSINTVFPQLATRCQERAFTKSVHNSRVCHCVRPWMDIYRLTDRQTDGRTHAWENLQELVDLKVWIKMITWCYSFSYIPNSCQCRITDGHQKLNWYDSAQREFKYFYSFTVS